MSAEIPVTVFTETLKKNGKEGEIKDIATDSQAYIVGAEVYVTADSTISPTEHGFHNSPGKSADLHVTLLIKEKRGDIVGLKFIYTVDGSVWDRLHVPKNARGYGFTKGNVLAVISEDDYKATRGPSNSTLPGKKVKTYWVSLDGKTTDEIELTTGTKITDTDRVKILKGLRSVPKAVYDKAKAGAFTFPAGTVKLVPK